MTDIAAEGVLISAADLAVALASAQPPILLDIRWVAGKVDLDGYLAGHLPRAVFLVYSLAIPLRVDSRYLEFRN